MRWQKVNETCDDGNLEDDDGCSATCQFEGCTDPEALNYDSLAVIDDGSCSYDGTTEQPPLPAVIPVTSLPFIIPVTGLELKYNFMFILAGLGIFGFSLIYEGFRRRKKM